MAQSRSTDTGEEKTKGRKKGVAKGGPLLEGHRARREIPPVINWIKVKFSFPSNVTDLSRNSLDEIYKFSDLGIAIFLSIPERIKIYISPYFFL